MMEHLMQGFWFGLGFEAAVLVLAGVKHVVGRWCPK